MFKWSWHVILPRVIEPFPMDLQQQQPQITNAMSIKTIAIGYILVWCSCVVCVYVQCILGGSFFFVSLKTFGSRGASKEFYHVDS